MATVKKTGPEKTETKKDEEPEGSATPFAGSVKDPVTGRYSLPK